MENIYSNNTSTTQDDDLQHEVLNFSIKDFMTQFNGALSSSFPTLGFVVAWFVYRSTGDHTKAIMGFFIGLIPVVVALLARSYIVK
jgi:hypothetical protein